MTKNGIWGYENGIWGHKKNWIWGQKATSGAHLSPLSLCFGSCCLPWVPQTRFNKTLLPFGLGFEQRGFQRPQIPGSGAEHPSHTSQLRPPGVPGPSRVAGRPERGSLDGIKTVPHSCLRGKKRKKKIMKGPAGFSCKFSPGSALCARSPFERGLEFYSHPSFQSPGGGKLENAKGKLRLSQIRAGICFFTRTLSYSWK